MRGVGESHRRLAREASVVDYWVYAQWQAGEHQNTLAHRLGGTPERAR